MVKWFQQPRWQREAEVTQAALTRLSGGIASEIKPVALWSYRAGPLTHWLVEVHGPTDTRISEQHRNIVRDLHSVDHRETQWRETRRLPSTASSIFSSSLSMLLEAAGRPRRGFWTAFPVTHGASWAWHGVTTDGPFLYGVQTFSFLRNLKGKVIWLSWCVPPRWEIGYIHSGQFGECVDFRTVLFNGIWYCSYLLPVESVGSPLQVKAAVMDCRPLRSIKPSQTDTHNPDCGFSKQFLLLCNIKA